MKGDAHIAGITALVGEPARAEMLTALMADRALTAGELADIAGVGKATASSHLAKLRAAGLVAVYDQGRHRYFRLADRDVAQLLESLMGVAFRTGAVRLKSSPREPALRRARVCYDHLAGELGVQAFESLLARGVFATDGAGLRLTPRGREWFSTFGVDVPAVQAQRRMMCRACLDWSGRRHHLAGAWGAALLQRLFELGWAQRVDGARVVRFTPPGERAFQQAFGLPVEERRAAAQPVAS
ncbi:MAG: winged helix-turn-helix transcriptional regulator [Ideonella sp.]|nr:winged helix-turn-helix transcriptional regulator [Ideonella sp.]MCC7456340.1 winged helix-turn-helix transcriptional regulator [Nitrospira sp.]